MASPSLVSARKVTARPKIICLPPCGLPTPNPQNYKYKIFSQVPGYGHSFTGYNAVNNYVGYGYDNNNVVQYAGTVQANPNQPSYSSTHTVAGHTVGGNVALPVITGNTNFSVADINGLVHNISVNGSTVTDVASLSQGGVWTLTVSTVDAQNWTVSYSNSVNQSGTFTFQVPANAYRHEHLGALSMGSLAYDPSVLSDVGDKPVQIAQKPCCVCLNDTSYVAVLAMIAMGALAISIGPEILGIAATTYIFGYGGAYLGAAGATLGWMYNRFHC